MANIVLPEQREPIVAPRSRRIRKILYWTLGVLVALLGVVLAGIWWYHPRLIYYPVKYPGRPSSIFTTLAVTEGVTVREEGIRSQDGTKLVGYWFRHPEADRRDKKLTSMLYLHGNRGDLEESFAAIAGWQRNMPLNVYMISYRGFGFSEGTPSMRGIRDDSQAALDHLMQHPEVDPFRLIIYGHSLGGSVALHLTRANPTHFFALFIENTFMSIKKMASHRAPQLEWATMVVTEKWDNEEELRELVKVAHARTGRFPHLLFLVGEQDRTVLPHHMTALWEEAQRLKGEKDIRVERISFPHCRHTCYPQTDYFAKVSKFYYEVTGDEPLAVV